jgi:dTDP-4-dehydrorhamnose reductase
MALAVKPKILLLGRDGQVGFALQRSLAALGDLTALGRSGCDLASLDAVRARMHAARPDIVVNAAAYTAVDRAETEPELVMRVNAEAPGELARAAARSGALLVHYSSDYVFDGAKPAPYAESDAPAPLNAYGRGKLAGDMAVQAAGGRHLILRTSWVHGAHGGNFLKTMLRLLAERDTLRVTAGQTGAPTGAALIADVTASLIARYIASKGEDYPYGLYHLAAAGATTWYGYARLIVQQALAAGMTLRVTDPDAILPVSAAEYPLPAPRPANSRLDTGKIQAAFGVRLPPWQDGARDTVRELALASARGA